MTRAAPYNRDRALDAAMHLFWEKGYHATSLKDLETALSMKPGSIYAAFKSKEALYLSSLERYFEQGQAQLEMSLADAASPLETLATHLEQFAKSDGSPGCGRACMIVKTLIDATSDDKALTQSARAYFDAMRETFAAGFEAAQNAGEIAAEADPQRLARRYQANVSALRIERQRGAPQAHIDALAEDMVHELEALKL